MKGTPAKASSTTFASDYREALAAFVLQGAGEEALMRAYELGRRAVVEQRNILDLAALHQNTMLIAVLRQAPAAREREFLMRGEAFFAEVMAPYEMMHRGYVDTIHQLQEVNENLEQRVDERTRALRDSEHKNARLARLYSILSGINSAIVRLRDREELFREACRIATVHGHFAVAWVGLVAADGTTLPTVWRSRRQDGRDGVDASVVKLAARGKEAITAAVRGNSVVVQRSPPEPLVEFPFRAYAVLPLRLSGRVVGILALYAEEASAFDVDEMRLLDELAGDLSFALEHIHKEEQLAYVAYYDVLTGLPNANLLFERLARQIQAADRERTLVAVLLVDLVRFSNINDIYGRHVGDQLLKEVGERLTGAVAAHDTVARMGADRFGVMLTDLTDADQVAHKLECDLLGTFSRPFRSGDTEIHLDAQVGISLYPADATDADHLYKNAEIALKRAQHEGERYLVFDPPMNDRIVRAVTLEAKLRKALARDELLVHYQPKVASDTGRMVGMEALVRYVDPEQGVVPPTQFVPLLEETGMINEVGLWVMRKAADDLRRWREQGLGPPRVAVNVSPIQMRQKEFVPALEAIAREAADGALGLDIEVTESAVMEAVEENIVKLEAVRALGFQIAIDDFGTGYSSLSYLTRLPLNHLKIDRSFIVAMTESPSGLAIVTAIISLAHSLGLKVIAEGVELEEQAKLLRLLRCEQIQGNLYNHPMPRERIAALLAAQ